MGEATTRQLPTGTITFLLTDIEGSTRLLTQLGGEYREVLETHQRLLRDVFARHEGVEVSTEGDSFFVVFPGAAQAVAAGVDTQRALSEHVWPEGARVRVRIGIHTGDGVLGGDNYVGVDVHRAARIASAGHGGQILVSAATHGLVDRSAPPGVAFRDLGALRLRDLPDAERLFQVLADGLASDFPPPTSIDARPNNLPPQLTSFVGRARELEEIKNAVRESRALTLTGPGGTGKTRLAIQTASDLLPELEHGAFFVALAPITDPRLVMTTVVEALGLPEDASRSSLETVVDHVRDRDLLLVFDNLEQVLGAVGEIGELLSGASSVRLLSTSREPLGLHGEREYPVPPLDLPDVEHLPSLESLSQYTAVELFIERASVVRPGFEITNENAPAVAEICARLDGLPLAIELAAARVKVLSPQEILRRLDDRLGFLTGGARDRPGRQQTLRNAIAWSHDLLDDDERSLFSSLAVFSRGFRLEAAETVCGATGGPDVFEGVASLVNKSLVRQIHTAEGDSRFLILETIREFASERLAERADAPDVRRRHARYFAELAAAAAPNLFGADQGRWLGNLAAEHDNLRAALAWSEESGDVELALRMSANLWRFWQMRGHLREAAERLAHVLGLPGSDELPAAKADALEAAGGVAYWMAETLDARRYYRACMELRRAAGDERALAEAQYNLSFPYTFTRRGVDRDEELARELLTEALERFRDLEDEPGIAKTLWGLGDLAYELRRYEEAVPYLVEALERQRRIGDRFGEAWSLFVLGLVELNLGRNEDAEPHLVESLSILSEAGDVSGVPLLLAGLGALAAERGDGERAVKLAASALAIEATGGGGLAGVSERVEEWEAARRALVPDQEEYGRLWVEGERLAHDEAIALALGERAQRSEVP